MLALHWAADLYKGRVSLPPATGTGSAFYQQLQELTSLGALKSHLSKASGTDDTLADYIRVVKSHTHPSLHFQDLVDKHSLPCFQLDELRLSDTVDTRAVYLLELATTADAEQQSSLLARFGQCKCFIAFVALTPAPTAELSTWDHKRSFTKWSSVLSAMQRSCIYVLCSAEMDFQLKNLVAPAGLHLTIGGARSIEFEDVDIQTEVQGPPPQTVDLFTKVTVRRCPQRTLDCLKPLVEKYGGVTVDVDTSDYDLEDFLQGFTTVSFPRFVKLFKKDNLVEPSTLEISGLTLSTVSNLRLEHFHSIKDITLREQHQYMMLFKIVTAPRDFHDTETRPVCENLVCEGEMSDSSKLVLCSFFLFPQFKDCSLNIERLDFVECRLDGVDIFKGFGPEIYGDLFQCVTELKWRADPRPLVSVDGLFDRLEQFDVQVTTAEEAQCVREMVLPRVQRLTLFYDMEGEVCLPNAPEVFLLTLIVKKSSNPVLIKDLSVKYPKLQTFSLEDTGKFYRSVEIPTTEVHWSDVGVCNSLTRVVGMYKFSILHTSFFQHHFPALKELGGCIKEESLPLLPQLQAPLQTLSLTVVDPHKDTSITLTTLTQLEQVQLHGIGNITIHKTPGLETLYSSSEYPVYSLSLDKDLTLYQATYHSVDKKAVHTGAEGTRFTVKPFHKSMFDDEIRYA